MSGTGLWIMADAEGFDDVSQRNAISRKRTTNFLQRKEETAGTSEESPGTNLRAHTFPVRVAGERLQNAGAGAEDADGARPPYVQLQEERWEERRRARESQRQDELDREADLKRYRGRTVRLLRRYLRTAIETGRLPSVLGSAFFRSGVTSYGVVTFEDRVIFVRDMEICLEKLDDFSRQVIARYVLQEHNLADAARLLNCDEKTIRRKISLVLDDCSEILLKMGLLESLDPNREKPCQGGKIDEIFASDC